MSRASRVSELVDPALIEELVDAWRSLGGRHRVPERIDVLKRHHKEPKVCRLVGCASGGGDVVAKRSNRAAVEPILYEQVLTTMPSTPRCHGVVAGRDGGRCWTFLEHVDGERYVASLAEHRAHTARWLGALHAVTSDMPLGQLLPQRDSAYYRNQLRTVRQAISAGLGSAMFDSDGRSRLAAALDHCDLLESRWEALETLTGNVRPGLVHGDLQSKNLRIRHRGGVAELVAFDWEFSGYGVPAADLAEFAVEGRWRELGILDQMGFASGWSPDRLRWLATAGRVFRIITWLEWASRSVRYASPRSVQCIAVYDLMLDECLRALPTHTPGG